MPIQNIARQASSERTSLRESIALFGSGAYLVMILGAVFLPETRGKTFDTRRRSQRSATLRGRGCRLKGLALFERNAPNVASRLLVRSIPDLVAVEQELTTENQEPDP